MSSHLLVFWIADGAVLVYQYLLLWWLTALKCLVTVSAICKVAIPIAVLSLLFPMEAFTLVPWAQDPKWWALHSRDCFTSEKSSQFLGSTSLKIRLQIQWQHDIVGLLHIFCSKTARQCLSLVRKKHIFYDFLHGGAKPQGQAHWLSTTNISTSIMHILNFEQHTRYGSSKFNDDVISVQRCGLEPTNSIHQIRVRNTAHELNFKGPSKFWE